MGGPAMSLATLMLARLLQGIGAAPSVDDQCSLPAHDAPGTAQFAGTLQVSPVQLMQFWSLAVAIYLIVLVLVAFSNRWVRKYLDNYAEVPCASEGLAFADAAGSGSPTAPRDGSSQTSSPAHTAASAASLALNAAVAATTASQSPTGATHSLSLAGSSAGLAAVAADAAATASIAASAAAAAAEHSAFVRAHFLLRFADNDLEKRWTQHVADSACSKHRSIFIAGAVLLLALNLTDIVACVRVPQPGARPWCLWLLLTKVVAAASILATGLVVCPSRARTQSAAPNPSSPPGGLLAANHCDLGAVLAAVFFHVPAQHFPPFTGEACSGCYSALDSDCRLQGNTALQMQILLVWFASWVLPQFEMLHLVWFWILGVHVGWTLAWQWVSGEQVHSTLDVATRAFVLGVTVWMAIDRRFHRERGERLRFLQDLQQRETSKQVFSLLEYMMPFHVIGPMLKSPDVPIAEHVDRVSILFIMIAGFDDLVVNMKPSQLLNFLNKQYVYIDQICVANGVAKIETVREEYVACVGVLPADREESARNGHSSVLERLVKAAGQILQLQNHTVRFKMGIHTGPIVAGVIGSKLPRYRLFGDTINFAARHMQKGVVGQLQFGEETLSDLPQRYETEVVCRGHVEMKGKGHVKAYLYEPKRTASQTLNELPTFLPKPSLSESARPGDINVRFEAALQQVTSTEKAQARRWFLSEREGFSLDLEETFRHWHHMHYVCQNITGRIGKLVIVLVILSGLDQTIILRTNVGMYRHRLYEGAWRTFVFTYCRTASLLIMLGLWYLCDTSRDWVLSRPVATQILMVGMCCTMALLLLLSVDALITSDDFGRLPVAGATQQAPNAPQDQTLKVVFILLFNSATKALSPMFSHSLVFVALAVVISLLLDSSDAMALHDEGQCRNQQGQWFSLQGGMLFVAFTIWNAMGSHQEEQDSRARYKSKCAVELTSGRAEALLDKLMPPLVVEQLRSLPQSAPPPTHQYRHATIAQSDLAGFTKLAGTRSPAEVVRFMGDLFGAFDKLTDKHEVYKVDTVGDAYIAGMAEEPLTRKNNPLNVVLFGLDCVLATQAWAKNLGVSVTCRVGVHYGQCVGGIVGKSMRFKLGAESGYQLFGPLLKVLEILESTAPDGKVQLSRACKEEVDRQLATDSDSAPRADHLQFELRTEPHLTTSKGEVFAHLEIGGLPYLVHESAEGVPRQESRASLASDFFLDSPVAALSRRRETGAQPAAHAWGMAPSPRRDSFMMQGHAETPTLEGFGNCASGPPVPFMESESQCSSSESSFSNSLSNSFSNSFSSHAGMRMIDSKSSGRTPYRSHTTPLDAIETVDEVEVEEVVPRLNMRKFASCSDAQIAGSPVGKGASSLAHDSLLPMARKRKPIRKSFP